MTAITKAIHMTDGSTQNPAATLRIMTFLSPAFPTGGFAWSNGLEQACNAGLVSDAETLTSWLRESLKCGSIWNDATLCAAAWNGDGMANETALALAGSKQRYDEQTSLASAFISASVAWRDEHAPHLPQPMALPCAIGALAREQELPLAALLVGFVQSAISNQIQAALRLFDLGQKAALEVTHKLEADMLNCIERSASGSLDDLGSATVMADISSMRHETLESRIFRS